MKLSEIDYGGELVEYKMSKEELKDFMEKHLPEEDRKHWESGEIKNLCFSSEEEKVDNEPKLRKFIFYFIIIVILLVFLLGLKELFKIIIGSV